MDLRKSQIPSKEIAGNAIKYESYREAWSRIKFAQENGFFLEAITIQESIISDRLISFLSRSLPSNSPSKNQNGQYPSLYNLIKQWREKYANGLQSGSYQNLIEAVNDWRIARNETIHAIVKSEPGEATQPIDSFLKKAKETAEEGECLAREVCRWSQKEKNLTS